MSAVFQLFIITGMLLTYCISYTEDFLIVSCFCGAAPVVFGILMFFMPESPLFYMIKDKEDAARKAMLFFRGKDFDIEPEIKDFKVRYLVQCFVLVS